MPFGEGAAQVHHWSSFSLGSSSQDLSSSQATETPASSQLVPETQFINLPTKANPSASSATAPTTHDAIGSQTSEDAQMSAASTASPVTTEIAGSQTLQSTTSSCDGFLIPKLTSTKSAKQKRDTFTLFDESQTEPRNTTPFLTTSTTDTSVLPATLKRAASQPRLYTSLDGSVRIKTGDSPSPSRPRPLTDNPIRQPRASGPLQRSQSAFVPPTFRSVAATGRSRDSRTWTFYCDSEARDELTKQAEREQSGSAVGAIGLIRSRSKGSLIAGARINTTNNKRVSPSINAKKPESQKRLKADDTSAKSASEKPKSQVKKAEISAMAKRLANPLSAVTMTHPHINKIITDPSKTSSKPKPKKEKKKMSTDIDTEVDGNESDKENWAPGTQTVVSPVRRQPRLSANAASARVLRENERIPSTSTSLGTMLARSGTSTPAAGKGKGTTPGRHNRLGVTKDGKQKPAKQGPEIDEEIAKFMAEGIVEGENGAAVGAGEEDLSCVQGLLSLSQGEWR
ncbi:MAG: hypothetical protein Q9202_002444 [Teloschistes flavicans]